MVKLKETVESFLRLDTFLDIVRQLQTAVPNFSSLYATTVQEELPH